ncbi:Nodulation protein N [Niveispirillum lacus]|uniref:Nodulation protein N n=2 Tax=Niveispirillum lacus TaxID=1981099 RepID=A0A255Z1E0_9PROT|nr:Nodulation protein N [Niveispirillum lacus]
MTLPEYQARIGAELGRSDWLIVDQGMIDRFADLTGDHQFIHVDPVRAAATPLGGTVAHGFLTLSLLGAMGMEMVPPLDNVAMIFNYGFDKLRFITPVRSGNRIRGILTLLAVETRGKGQYLMRYGVTVEAEGEVKPALAAEWLVMMITA